MNETAANLPAGFAPDPGVLRKTMVDCQIRTFGVTDAALLAQMFEVARENFLPENLRALAYSDKSLQIKSKDAGEGRWLLPPLVLARLIQESDVAAKDDVLDIAAGGGYSTALLAGLAHRVIALEEQPGFHEILRRNLDLNGLETVAALCGPLHEGAPQFAPFDVIFINGGVEGCLDQLAAQLKEGGRIMAIERLDSDPNGCAMKAVRFKLVAGALSSRTLFDATVPLLKDFRKEPQFSFN